MTDKLLPEWAEVILNEDDEGKNPRLDKTNGTKDS